ncbi:MAG: hypothetical protein JWO96_710 [Candidatus Saccharibacteria bacterium]|nr:hypothetical protein [Candidatus Saccharibacteria bacterium]
MLKYITVVFGVKPLLLVIRQADRRDNLKSRRKQAMAFVVIIVFLAIVPGYLEIRSATAFGAYCVWLIAGMFFVSLHLNRHAPPEGAESGAEFITKALLLGLAWPAYFAAKDERVRYWLHYILPPKNHANALNNLERGFKRAGLGVALAIVAIAFLVGLLLGTNA